MACPDVKFELPPIELKKNLNFNSILLPVHLNTLKPGDETMEEQINAGVAVPPQPILLSPPQITRMFEVEEQQYKLNEKPEIDYKPRNREHIVRNEGPTTDNERMLLEIANLSRELDYLTLIDANLNALLDESKRSKADAHPLAKKNCFKRNKAEYRILKNILETS